MSGLGRSDGAHRLMRYALLSDVHGNRPALEAVLADIARRKQVDAIHHLGDLVGYGPWPNEVVTMIRDAGIMGVAGNYDSTVATAYKHCGCRYEDPRQESLAHESYAWTLANISTESRQYLGALPFALDLRPLGGHQAGPTVRLVHGNQSMNTVYVGADRSDEFLARMSDAMQARAGDIVAFGHTHIAWHRLVGGVHFVNTGSVGRPKDGDARAGYVLLDVTAGEIAVEIVRVSYDVEAAIRGIGDSALPNEFAEFLRTGGAPAA